MQSSSEDFSPAITFDTEEFRQQLRRIKANKAAGPDGVHPRTLKDCADQLCSVLHSMFLLYLSKNTSFMENILPGPHPKESQCVQQSC